MKKTHSSRSSQSRNKNQASSPSQRSYKQGKAFPRGSKSESVKRSDQRSDKKNERSNVLNNYRVVVGTHAIRESMVTQPKEVFELWTYHGFESNPDLKVLVEDAQKLRIKTTEHPRGFLDNQVSGHQGAILLTSYTPEVDWESLHQKDTSTVLFLDGIEDPHNLGAILRTAWLTHVDAVTIPADRAAGLTPAVHKVACGGVEHVPVEQTNNFLNLVEGLKENGFWVFGLSHNSNKSIFDLKLPSKVVWIVGSEDKGMRTSSERLCDELVSLPQASAPASYNASVATALALMETVRQRKLGQKQST